MSAESDTARRYADHAARGWSIHLEGSRPVASVWRLAHPLPAALFQQHAPPPGG